jgi:hypothetical protein
MKIDWLFMYISGFFLVTSFSYLVLSLDREETPKPKMQDYLRLFLRREDVRSNFIALIFFSLFLSALSALFVWVDDRPANLDDLQKYFALATLLVLGEINVVTRLFLLSKSSPSILHEKMSGADMAKTAFSIGAWPRGYGVYSIVVTMSQVFFLLLVIVSLLI